MNNKNLQKVGVIFDNSGSIYVAHILSEHPDYYLIYNPAQLFYNLNDETKDVEINMIPVCLPEILSEEAKENGTTWTYKKSNARFVSTDSLLLDVRILDHYNKIFTRNNS